MQNMSFLTLEDGTTGPTVESFWAVVSLEEKGERICAIVEDSSDPSKGVVPLMTSNPDKLPGLMQAAAHYANHLGAPLRLIRFQRAEVFAEYAPLSVPDAIIII